MIDVTCGCDKPCSTPIRSTRICCCSACAVVARTKQRNSALAKRFIFSFAATSALGQAHRRGRHRGSGKLCDDMSICSANMSPKIPFASRPGLSPVPTAFGSQYSSLMCDPIADSIRQFSISGGEPAICSIGAHPDATERAASKGGMETTFFIVEFPCCAKA